MSPAAKKPDDSKYSGRFAIRLRELRVKAGLSVEETVKQLNGKGCKVAVRSYYNWEGGAALPSIKDLPTLAAIFELKSPRTILPPE